jgi:UDP-perosamine 4-acetyltransferase
VIRYKRKIAMELPVIVLGGGGYARVLIDILQLRNVMIVGISLPEPTVDELYGYRVIGNDEDVLRDYSAKQILLVNAVGSVGLSAGRRALYEKYHTRGYRFASVIHPSAVIASDCRIGEGVQIMAGAIVQPGCRLGDNVIINTKASIDHDVAVGHHAHVAVGVTVAGGVKIGDGAFIGAGSTIIQNITIGGNSLVGAGAVVVRDVRENTTVMGVPAREVIR